MAKKRNLIELYDDFFLLVGVIADVSNLSFKNYLELPYEKKSKVNEVLTKYFQNKLKLDKSTKKKLDRILKDIIKLNDPKYRIKDPRSFIIIGKEALKENKKTEEALIHTEGTEDLEDELENSEISKEEEKTDLSDSEQHKKPRSFFKLFFGQQKETIKNEELLPKSDDKNQNISDLFDKIENLLNEKQTKLSEEKNEGLNWIKKTYYDAKKEQKNILKEIYKHSCVSLDNYLQANKTEEIKKFQDNIEKIESDLQEIYSNFDTELEQLLNFNSKIEELDEVKKVVDDICSNDQNNKDYREITSKYVELSSNSRSMITRYNYTTKDKIKAQMTDIDKLIDEFQLLNYLVSLEKKFTLSNGERVQLDKLKNETDQLAKLKGLKELYEKKSQQTMTISDNLKEQIEEISAFDDDFIAKAMQILGNQDQLEDEVVRDEEGNIIENSGKKR